MPRAVKLCEWPVLKDGEPCGQPAHWELTCGLHLCSEHYDMIHGVGDRMNRGEFDDNWDDIG
jgi:hypothetical protein